MGKFQPGQSGNIKGRPPKKRALTEILERAGGRSVNHDGRRVAGRRALAAMVWEGLLTGVVSFPDGKSIRLGPADWKDLVKWLYTHIDGPPSVKMDITSAGERLDFDYGRFIGAATRPVQDSGGPGGD